MDRKTALLCIAVLLVAVSTSVMVPLVPLVLALVLSIVPTLEIRGFAPRTDRSSRQSDDLFASLSFRGPPPTPVHA